MLEIGPNLLCAIFWIALFTSLTLANGPWFSITMKDD